MKALVAFALAAPLGVLTLAACTPRPAYQPGPTVVRRTVPPDAEHPSEPQATTDSHRIFGAPRATTVSPRQPSNVTLESAAANQPTPSPPAMAPAGTSLFRGLLHSHTLYSDGSGTPSEAYERAKSKGLDFFGVTEHNHSAAEGSGGPRKDGVLIANDHGLYNSGTSVSFTRRWRDENGQEHTEQGVDQSVITAANEATDGSFVGLYGQEFSTISSGNHVNVIGVHEVLTVRNGDFKALYEHLAAGGTPYPVVQMNHPDVSADLFRPSTTERERQNDYGFDDYDKDFSTLVAAADPFIAVIELVSGPALKDRSYEKYRYSNAHEDDYYFYLTQGFHISPSAGHDDHFRQWGDKTPGRMGVFAAGLTREALLGAMRGNRTFASEDAKMAIDFECNGQSMGSVLSLPKGATISCDATVSDSDEPSAEYSIILVYGTVEPQDESNLTKWTAIDGLQATKTRDGDGSVAFDEYAATGAPEFFYVRAQQTDGDRAWAAPVWINHPREEMVE